MKSVKIITHSGSFHPDDCFATASLLLLLESEVVSPEIVRSRDEGDIKTGDFVVDVGNVYDPSINRFDHHQIGGAGTRSNGIPYASFGLVWKTYGSKICGSEVAAENIDRMLVQSIDAMDNGVDIVKSLIAEDTAIFSVNDVINSFLPTWKSKDTADEKFMDAVSFAKSLLERLISRAKDDIEGETHVLEAYSKAKDKRIVILEREYNWKETIAKFSEPLLVIFPQGENFHVKAVRSGSGFQTKISFPTTWAGKRDKELAVESGVEDAVFCHNNLFMAVARTQEGAEKMARIVLEKGNIN